ncbi:MAG: transposase family protein [Lachnospiraceae bacterium]
MTSEQMNLQSFYPDDLEVKNVLQSDQMITIKMNAHSNRCICPKCGVTSSHKHGTYERKIQDLPILGKSTQLLVNAYDYGEEIKLLI